VTSLRVGEPDPVINGQNYICQHADTCSRSRRLTRLEPELIPKGIMSA